MLTLSVLGRAAVDERGAARMRWQRASTEWRNAVAAVRALTTVWLLAVAVPVATAFPVNQLNDAGEETQLEMTPAAEGQPTTADQITLEGLKLVFASASYQRRTSAELSSSSTTMPQFQNHTSAVAVKVTWVKVNYDDNGWTDSSGSVAPGLYVLVAFLVVGPLAICCGVGWYHCWDVCVRCLCPHKLRTTEDSAAIVGASTSDPASRGRNPVLALRRAIHRRRAATGGRPVARVVVEGAPSGSAMSDMSPYEVIRYIALSMHNSAGQQEQQEQEQQQPTQQMQLLQVPTTSAHKGSEFRCQQPNTNAEAATDETAEMTMREPDASFMDMTSQDDRLSTTATAEYNVITLSCDYTDQTAAECDTATQEVTATVHCNL